MTSPTARDRAAEATTEEPISRLAVVSFVHRDPILGGAHPTVGVVVEVGDVLTVMPTELRYLRVRPEDVRVLTLADLDVADEHAEDDEG